MNQKRLGRCIFSCNNKTCVNDSTETFKNIICPYHLAQVFGLQVQVEVFEKESADYYVGPFLILDKSFSFEPNTVVFPERNYIDQFLNINDVKDAEFYNYKMNPRMATYLTSLRTNEFNFTPSDNRYQTEVIRNLFFTVKEVARGQSNEGNQPAAAAAAIPEMLNLAKDSEMLNTGLFVHLKLRLGEINTIIATEEYYKIFENMSVIDVSNGGTLPFETFTPFMNFMLFNCLTDEHTLPHMTDKGLGITCYLNLLYKKGVGFVTTQELIHPAHLIIGGKTVGNNNFYQLKVRSVSKRTIQNNPHNMRKKNLADNVRSSNILNPQLDFCWTHKN